MRYFKRCLLMFAAACLVTNVAVASLVVIANPKSKVSQLSKYQLQNLFLGKPSNLPKGVHLQPVNLPESSATYNQFYRQIANWSPSQVSSYWSSLVFTGQANQPPSVNSAAQAIAEVEQNPNAVAYVDSKDLASVGNNVKVLYGNYKPTNNVSDSSKQNTEPLMGNSASSGGYHSMFTKNTGTTTRAEKNNNIAQTLASLPSYTTDSNGNLWRIIQQHIVLSPADNNAQVRHQILWYLSHRGNLYEMLNDSQPYIYYVYQQTKQRNMPAMFALLPMVESGYNPYAYSDVGAAGLWQMMPGTASSFGLDITWWNDQRRNIQTSTNAALNYLVRLHNNLGSWYLAAAGYDAGQGAIQGAVQYNLHHHRPTDFWSLPLPEETRNYVPKLLALATIIKKASQYGIHLPNVPDHSYFVGVKLQSQIDITQAARLAGVSQAVIQQLNPGMRRYATNPDSTYTLLIPATKLATFNANYSKLIGKTHISWQYHEVRKGETIDSIAANYHTNVKLLSEINALHANDLRTGQGILVPISLNHRYKSLQGVSTPTSVSKLNTSEISKLNVNDILSSPHVKQPQLMIKSLVPPSKAKKPQQPIKSNESLKSLVDKIYGDTH